MGLEIIQLLMRSIFFAAGLFFLLEYVVVCSISTAAGVALVILTVLLCLLGFSLLRMRSLGTCETCNAPKFAPLFDMKKWTGKKK
jgi:hypothetical protein